VRPSVCLSVCPSLCAALPVSYDVITAVRNRSISSVNSKPRSLSLLKNDHYWQIPREETSDTRHTPKRCRATENERRNWKLKKVMLTKIITNFYRVTHLQCNSTVGLNAISVSVCLSVYNKPVLCLRSIYPVHWDINRLDQSSEIQLIVNLIITLSLYRLRNE